MRKFVTTLFFAFCASYHANAQTELPSLGDGTSGLISLQQEQALGHLWLRQLRSYQPTLDNPELTTWLADTIYQLVPHANLQIPDLELVIVDSPVLNAFAVPGGIVGINYGLFLYTDDEDELSSVLAHELAHLSQRHFARQVEAAQRQNPIALATLLASIVLIATNNPDAGFAGLISSQAATLQNQLAFSRDFEREADRMGMQIMVNSGLDAHAMPDMFDNMLGANRYQSTALEFLMTHPLTATRVADAGNRAEQHPTKPRRASFEYLTFKYGAERRYVLKSNASEEFQHRLQEATGKERAALIYQMADIALKEQEFNAGLDWLNKMPSEQASHAISRSLQARLMMGAGNISQAIEMLEQQLSIQPSSLTLQYAMVSLLIKDRQMKEATSILKGITEKHPTTPTFWALLSHTASSSGDKVLAYRALAESFFYSGQQAEATQQMESAIREATSEKDFVRESALKERLKEIQGSPSRLPG